MFPFVSRTDANSIVNTSLSSGRQFVSATQMDTGRSRREIGFHRMEQLRRRLIQ